MENNDITPEEIKQDIDKHMKMDMQTDHAEILRLLLNQFQTVNFRALAGLTDDDEKLHIKHILVSCIEEVLRVAKNNNWGMCKNHDFVYLYNGAFWEAIDKEQLQNFLGEAAERMEVEMYTAKYYLFREQLYKQFLATAYLPKPNPDENAVAINLKNGTFIISPKEQVLRQPQPEDFITYQLPFSYNPEATAPIFMGFLKEVQPDIKRQMILAESVAYVFINPKTLKLEKTALLYGNGANGKSVFFEVITALLGSENVSNYSLQSLTDKTGYYRAMMANKLLNYASEINGKLETSIFKQLVSGEPVEARLPYGNPFVMTRYAKLIFNCNELPKEVEQTNAFFRRLLIIPFDVTIPAEAQDKELATRIIENELSGVFNWVLEGLKRLLKNRNFTDSEAVNNQLEQYKAQSDSVRLFLDDKEYKPSTEKYLPLKEIFTEYRTFCHDNIYHPCSNRTFSERLRKMNFCFERKNAGMVVFIEKTGF